MVKGRKMTFTSMDSLQQKEAVIELDQALEVNLKAKCAARDRDDRTPEKIKELFRSKEMLDQLDVGKQEPEVISMKCPNFWPRLYGLILSVDTAARLVSDRRFRDIVAELVGQIGKLLGQTGEVALVAYADVPPKGQYPNVPVAAFAHNMEDWRLETLKSRLKAKSGINFCETYMTDSIAVTIGNPPFIGKPLFKTMERYRKSTKFAGAVAFFGLVGWAVFIVAHLIYGGSALLIVSAGSAMGAWAAAEFGRNTLGGKATASHNRV